MSDLDLILERIGNFLPRKVEKVPERDESGKIVGHKQVVKPYLPDELKNRFKLNVSHTPTGDKYELVSKDPQETARRKKGAIDPQNPDYIKKFIKAHGRPPLGSKTTQNGVSLPARQVMSREIGSQAALRDKSINKDGETLENKTNTETKIRRV